MPLEKDRRIAEETVNLFGYYVYYVLQFMRRCRHPVVTARLIPSAGSLFFIFMSVFFNEMLDIVNSSYLRKTKRKNHSVELLSR